ncbi:arylsulfotransferase family protein [Halomicrococcus sp. NG-SE-24]|uniref:arylsulfotransferase family protein n=1 Tax=Halomicrococcus sp. NG-SE-24 TaxID=3436928 RepID=UPI003D99D638
MVPRKRLRVAFGVLLVLCVGVLASGYAGQVTGSGAVADSRTTNGPHGIADVPADEITVVSDHKSPTVGSKLVAVGPGKDVLYHNATLDYYSDVDPSPAGKYTVTYVGAETIPKQQCDGVTSCRRMVIERLNMSTDEVDRLYSRVVPTYSGFRIPYTNRWHDVDRINDTHFAVADIERDRVFVVNTSSEIVTWQWQALAHYSHDSGGPFPNDFTHLNDVEMLPDGRIMVSIRNQDEVVFINRTTGVNESWTLGEEDNHSVLFGQHNPDYIPSSQGGPAVVVADSHNDRVVEFQRVDGAWKQSWEWKDARMQWTRDADRLPNGNTLVTDTHGNRVVEINEDGEKVWSAQFNFPYDAERLGTGDESAGGPSAQRADLAGKASIDGEAKDAESKAKTGDDGLASLPKKALTAVEDTIPPKLLNAALYVMPGWFHVLEVFALVGVLLVGLTWSLAEAYWRGYRLQLPVDRVASDEN